LEYFVFGDGNDMNTLDFVFASCAAIAALVLLLLSPWHRAVVKECLLHPLSEGWVEIEEGRVEVHRGQSLLDHTFESVDKSPGHIAGASS
jgi:hypothetical protein